LILVDTNILVRLRDEKNAEHRHCRSIIEAAAERRVDLVLCAQVMIEYWVVATRPKSNNGLGMTSNEVAADLKNLLTVVDLIPEPPDIGLRWLKLATFHQVSGKTSHDTRVAALMQAEGIRELLTLNPSDFHRYPTLTCVAPSELAARSSLGH
jgi:predicted nucleic acid-binding protein